MRANWTLFCVNPVDKIGTKLFGISYHRPEGEHILCTGMYEFQAQWLLELLKGIKPMETPEC